MDSKRSEQAVDALEEFGIINDENQKEIVLQAMNLYEQFLQGKVRTRYAEIGVGVFAACNVLKFIFGI